MSDALRPLTVGELLDRTFSMYRRHFVLFLGISALPHLLMLVFQLGRLFVGAEGGVFFSVLWFVALMFVYLTTAVLSQGATVVAVSQIQLDRETSVAEAFGRIRPRLGELIIISINMGIRIFAGILLLVVPGIMLAVRYALTIPVAVLEEKGPSESLSRSADLTKGHRWRVFFIYMLLIALTVIVGMLWQVPLMIAAAALRRGQFPLWTQVVTQFGNFATQSVLGPIMTIALALVYYDERVRKEAFDLLHMMQQIDATVFKPSTS